MAIQNFYRFARECAAGDYYRYAGEDERYIKTGSLAVVTEIGDGGEVVVNSLDLTLSFSAAEFAEGFVFEPNGKNIREAEREQVLRNALDVVEEIKKNNLDIERATSSGEKLKSLSQNSSGAFTDDSFTSDTFAAQGIESAMSNAQNNAGDLENGEIIESGETALIRKDDRTTLDKKSENLSQAETLRVVLAQKREQAHALEKSLAAQQSRLKNLKGEYDAYLEAVLQFKNLSKRIEETIYTLNIYLGTGEEIVQIKKGAAAPATEPLVFRQLCLFAAEESLINIDEGGMDNEDIGDFDRWLLRDENLRQILPEPKAVVAIKPRREDKDYGNRAANYFNNREKHKTYFILRNGDNVYRLAPNFNVGERLFPSRHEFDELFTEEYYDEESESYRTRKLHPGAPGFEKQSKAASEKELAYARGLILFQGIIDRTKIFPELHEMRLNLLDAENGSRWIRYIEDAEPSYLLETGIPSFSEWLAEAQTETQTGDRITGNFVGRTLEYDYQSGRAARLSPSSSEFPSSEQIYVLEKKRAGGFVFLYDRDEKVEKRNLYGGWNYGQAERRASCVIYPGDKWWLPIDRLKIGFVDFWLRDRISRASYLNMVPLLKSAKSILAEEAGGEKPVRELLLGLFIKIQADQLPKNHLLSLEELEEMAIKLVRWWRMKNKYHRALESDHAKAIRMIKSEFEKFIQVRKEEVKYFADRERILSGIVSEKTVFVYQHQPKEIVVMDRENADNVFVRRQTYRIERGGKTRRVGDENWKQVRALPGGLIVWRKSNEWSSWYRGSRINEILSDEEIKQNLDGWTQETRKQIETEATRPRYGEEKMSGYELYLYAATMTHKGDLNFYYGEVFPERGTKDFSLDYIFAAKKNRLLCRSFERTNQTIKLNQGSSSRFDGGRNAQFSEPEDFLTAEPGAAWHVSLAANARNSSPEKLLWVDRVVCRALLDRVTAVRPHNRFVNACRKTAQNAHHRLTEFLLDREYERLRIEYMNGFGDPHHWEDQKGRLEVPPYYRRVEAIRKTILGLLLRHVPLGDLAFGEIVEKSMEFFGECPSFGDDIIIPRELVLLPSGAKTEETREED